MCSSLLLHKAGVCFSGSRRDMNMAAGAGASGALAASAGDMPRAQAKTQDPLTRPKTKQAGRMIRFDPDRLIDLTHTLTPGFPVFPGGQQMKISPQTKVTPDGYMTSRLEIDEHTGTHMDAPAHFIADGLTADRLAISRFVCPLVVIDISARAARNHDATVDVADIAAWEKAHGRIPPDACVVMRSGWERRLKKPSSFLNQDDNAVMHTPGFSEEAAAFLVGQRSIAGVGVDTLSLDIGASTTFKAHLAVLGAGRWGIECLANLGQVPESGATVFIAPMKVLHGSGGPVRVYAALA